MAMHAWGFMYVGKLAISERGMRGMDSGRNGFIGVGVEWTYE